jgi:signal transduction histidine kinase
VIFDVTTESAQITRFEGLAKPPADDRLVVSIFQELTVAALDLFDPAGSIRRFLERVAERMGCLAVILLVESEDDDGLHLLADAGLAATSRTLLIPPENPKRSGCDRAVSLPYPELARPGTVTWCFPLDGEDDRVGELRSERGFLVLGFDHAPPSAPHHRGMMRRLARVFHTALVHRRLSERRIESERRAAFLAEASQLLSASLDEKTTLARAAELPVPFVAEVCLIDVIDRKGRLCRAEAFYAAPHLRNGTSPGAGDGPDGQTPKATLDAIGGREPIPSDFVEDESLRNLGIAKILSTPLITRGTTIGVLTLGWTAHKRAVTAEDQRLATELGRRLALAIDNARLYEQAQRAVRAREEIVAVVSHDLKSPLSTIMMNSGLLERSAPANENPQVARRIALIQKSADRMNRLIRDLLDLAKLDGGHIVFTPKPQEVAALLQDAVELFKEEATAKSLHIEQTVPEGMHHVHCDRERILQVLTNLVGNAVKFTPSGGKVTLAAKTDSRSTIISVCDTGPGIPEDERTHIFDRFWQATDTAPQGTGLGLSIAKALVEAQGGRIWVESVEGAGCTIFVALPATQPSAP